MTEIVVRESTVVQGFREVFDLLNTIQVTANRNRERIGVVEDQVDGVRGQLRKLQLTLDDFIRLDKLAKALMLAETRIVKVRQELETQYGFYAEVRRRSVGLLQAVDTGVVSIETIQSSTEDVMLRTPDYWLSPVLIALAAWLRDDKQVAERAIHEAVKRDSFKTSLALTLISRRLQRWVAAAAWLEAYFQHQNPKELDREFIVILDGVANGIFGVEGCERAMAILKGWMDELCGDDAFVSTQVERWLMLFRRMKPDVDSTEYPVLRNVAKEWPKMMESFQTASTHEVIHDHFKDILESPLETPNSLVKEIDGLVFKLVSEFSEVELPLRRKEKELQCIIDAGGDEGEGLKKAAEESTVLQEHVAYTELLTNAAILPEESKASQATQRLALATTRDWAAAAQHRLTAEGRMSCPAEVTLEIDGWEGKARDGSEQTELEQSLHSEFDRRRARALVEYETPGSTIAGYIFGAGLVLLAAFIAKSTGAGAALAGIIGIIVLAVTGTGHSKARAQHEGLEAAKKAKLDQEEEHARGVLRAAVAELVDFRQEWAERDSHALPCYQYIKAMSPTSYLRPAQKVRN